MLTEGHELLWAEPAWLEAPEWGDLYEAMALLYLARPGNFFILHAITSLWGVEQLAHWLPPEHTRACIQHWWTASLAVAMVAGAAHDLPTAAAVRQLADQYAQPQEHLEPWDSIIARALVSEDEHNTKLTLALRDADVRFPGRAALHGAASHFFASFD